ncbi:hypothetical protein EON63_11050 [archaeon]|nr:MAG: hypothetical protein EON63_11050 [archaeon]
MSKAPKSSTGSTRQNVKVVARVRPTNQKEVAMGGVTCVKHSQTNIEVLVDGNPNAFNFDRIFGAESTQEEVFQETARPLIEDVLAGYNATIFAYGQTGTGKVNYHLTEYIRITYTKQPKYRGKKQHYLANAHIHYSSLLSIDPHHGRGHHKREWQRYHPSCSGRAL